MSTFLEWGLESGFGLYFPTLSSTPTSYLNIPWAWPSERGAWLPGFWNLTFSYYIFSKRFSWFRLLVQWNFTNFSPPWQIFLATTVKITIVPPEKSFRRPCPWGYRDKTLRTPVLNCYNSQWVVDPKFRQCLKQKMDLLFLYRRDILEN